jgi:hypothetical protein
LGGTGRIHAALETADDGGFAPPFRRSTPGPIDWLADSVARDPLVVVAERLSRGDQWLLTKFTQFAKAPGCLHLNEHAERNQSGTILQERAVWGWGDWDIGSPIARLGDWEC